MVVSQVTEGYMKWLSNRISLLSLRSYAEFHGLLVRDSARINQGVTILSGEAIPRKKIS